MNAIRLMMAIAAVFALSFAAPLFAQEGEKKEEGKRAEEGKKEVEKEGEEKEGEAEEDDLTRMKKQFKDVDKVIAGVTLTKEDIESYEKHEDAFDEFVDSDEKFEKLANKNIKEAFDYAIKSEKYLAWAKERELEAETWLRKAVRILTFETRQDLADMDETVEEMKEWKKTLEDLKDTMTDEEYKEAIKETDDAIKMLEGMSEFAKSLPAPTEAEAKLFVDEEDGDEGEDEDSMD